MLFIDGSWVPAASGATFQSRNPATGEVLGEVADGGAEDARAAVAAARTAFTVLVEADRPPAVEPICTTPGAS